MDETEKLQTEMFTYIARMSEKIYNNEIQRTEAFIGQASRMQAAFSFMFAAIFMIAPIVLEYVSQLSKTFFVIAFSSIGLTLLFSVFSATMVQNRHKREDFVSAKQFSKYVIDNYEGLKTEAQRQKYTADTYAIIQKSMSVVNKKREKWIKASMISFYVTISLCVFWFVIAICKVL